MDFIKALRVDPDHFRLKKIDPGDTLGHDDKAKARAQSDELSVELRELQRRLYGEGRRSLLIVLQALDAAGKDGTIRRVMGGLNPQGTRVASFKRPTEEELAHDFLWRVHRQTPGRGMVGIFNRSHYEDVLVVRVHNYVPRKVWSKRYERINQFEKMLHEEADTTIVKLFLHISPEEQLERFKDRLDEPAKHWKLDLGDYDEREHWHDYQKAYQDALVKTSTPWAPWYVIPANRKWFRDLAVSNVLVETLKKMKLKDPEPKVDLNEVLRRYEQAAANPL